MMSRQLIIKIAPNEKMRFPSLCTNCARPSTQSMRLVKHQGRTRRQVEVPICAQCASEIAKKSAAEERLNKQSWLFATAAGLLIFLAALLLLPGSIFWLRFLVALLFAAAGAYIVLRFFRSAMARAALPEKKAVLESAQLQAFSWRTATFEFSNDTFVEHFVELNEPLLLES